MSVLFICWFIFRVEWPDIGVEKISGSDLLDDYAYPSIITHCDSTSDLNDLTSLPATINENSSDTQSATSSIEEDFWTEGEKMQLEKGLVWNIYFYIMNEVFLGVNVW